MNLMRAFTGLLLMTGTATLSFAHAQASSSFVGGVPRITDGRSTPPKVGWLFRSSELALAGATAFDMTTTANVLGHPTSAYRANGSFLMRYTTEEQGWAKCFGSRDTPAIIAGNVLMNVGVDRFSEKLATRGGRWRLLAFGLMGAKVAINSVDGIHNIRFDQSIDQRVRHETGYRGVILWRH